MIDYHALRAVALVIQTGSFDRAAKALNVTPSAVSQRVKLIEERLGAVLIERGTPCTPTEKGAWLCRHMDHVQMLEKDLIAQLPGLGDTDYRSEHVTLNIATNADSLATWFMAAITDFSERSDYLFNITIDDQGHTAEWLEKGRVLAAVTSLQKPVQGCHVTPLGTIRYVTVASPAFIVRHFPSGVTGAALSKAPALTFNQKDRLQKTWVHKAFGKDVTYPSHWLPSVHSFIDACVAGMGWALHPETFIADQLSDGRLVELISDLRIEVPLYWQINRLAADRLLPLTQTVVATARNRLRDA